MVEVYAGLDVSDKLTHVCVADGSGAVVWSWSCATDPEVIARTLKARAPGLVRVILETGPLSAILDHGLAELGALVTCVCARHAKGVLSARVNKSDPHDAKVLAQMARTGWFKAIRIKQEATHMDRARLKIREQLIDARQAMAGQLRGLLKLFGLRLGKVTTPNKRRERLEALRAAGLGHAARRNQGRQARRRRRRPQARHSAPPGVAVANRVPLGLTVQRTQTEGHTGTIPLILLQP